eukprot:14844490-Alexandrium_andersonii.AAC.1
MEAPGLLQMGTARSSVALPWAFVPCASSAKETGVSLPIPWACHPGMTLSAHVRSASRPSPPCTPQLGCPPSAIRMSAKPTTTTTWAAVPAKG